MGSNKNFVYIYICLAVRLLPYPQMVWYGFVVLWLVAGVWGEWINERPQEFPRARGSAPALKMVTISLAAATTASLLAYRMF